MILLIDNYDSFSYNLYQLIGSIREDLQVVRNDALSLKEIEQLQPEAIIISPGPGRPEDAGICIEAIRHFSGTVPIFGVCLGHQAIGAAFGAQVTYASRLMHGKESAVSYTEGEPLFKGMLQPFRAARYHSLAVAEEGLPQCLQPIAVTKDGELMAIRHKEHKTYGVQFHPESILTPQGRQIIKNFLEVCTHD
ncbi:MAG: aminodeoxychorismate/anthranilate synthase component II [Oscillospiraceae bacterium]|jgi:anthranilate synthase component 2|nr:aminodeoxychorismate/anthranilate synthase component II [Oscillospiraceae bacterium]